jgi:hypothetical protein
VGEQTKGKKQREQWGKENKVLSHKAITGIFAVVIFPPLL